MGGLPSLVRRNAFTLGLFSSVLLAMYWPELGAKDGLLRSEWTTKCGVCLIFFFQGLSLRSCDLLAGYLPIRLHVYVLLWNYLCFPLLVAGLLLLSHDWWPADIRNGFYLLSILPTTIASSVAFTHLAGGRVACALCSTLLSNLLSVVIVPLWIILYLSIEGEFELPLLPVFKKLALLIILPIILGQMTRVLLRLKAGLSMPWIKYLNSGVILFIVYAAFSESVASGFFASFAFFDLISVLLGVCCLLSVTSFFVWGSLPWLALKRGDAIAGYFCASQKSLATGLPLVSIILAALPAVLEINIAAVLLPLLCFHPCQLILAAWVANRFRGEKTTNFS